MSHDAAALLPTSAHVFERTLARAVDPTDVLGPSIDALHGLKINNPTASMLPYLVYEYGLGMLSPYLPNLYDLIGEGVDWERVRGTPAAVHQALGWIGYSASIEYAPPRRRYWNTAQLQLGRLRNDEADLAGIDGLTWLSIPLRSDLWRVWHGHDVRPLEYGWTSWGNGYYGDDSGVRLDGIRAKFSFGRTVYIDHEMTGAELTALGVWIEPTGTEALTWGDFSWGDFAWVDDAALARSRSMAAAMPTGTAWAVFFDAGGDVIGYRRCRARSGVAPQPGGPYRVGASYFRPATPAVLLFVEVLTDFGDGYGFTAAAVGFVFGAEPLAPHKPGAAWLPAGGLDPDLPIVALHEHTIEFGRTVRERVAAILRF
ncbi:phage tail protein [Ancylobacter sp. TS-1]|uniref:phage tail protein n=1 Tax=Ancylobacter sp. TS-1 TaxID=1850374 RepID=UPI0013920CE1|nr:phage tail protein [Ancylobacter sp. TS-1]